MDLSRRRMLQGILALAVTATTSLRWVAAADAAPAKSATSPSWFSRWSYVSLVGTPFTVGTAALTLTAIRDLTPQPVKERGNVSDGRFSLLFASPSALPQGTRTVHHGALGETALFVGPVRPPSSPRAYEVIVKRLA